MATTETDANTETARRALEVACAGKEPDAIDEVYAETFVDHVNSMEYRGTDGARQSVALYLELFPDLEFVIDEQVTEGNRVASRWPPSRHPPWSPGRALGNRDQPARGRQDRRGL